MSELVKCGDHGLAPSGVICKHLHKKTSVQWLPVKFFTEAGENDWICPKCFCDDVLGGNVDMKDLVVLCIHCLREVRGDGRHAFDPEIETYDYIDGILGNYDPKKL